MLVRRADVDREQRRKLSTRWRWWASTQAPVLSGANNLGTILKTR